MKQTILYDEAYNYNIKLDDNDFSIHFDYGTRYHQINMQFSHFHPYYEIYFLLNGDAQHFLEGQSFNLKTYDIVLINPYRLHRTNYLEYQPCKRLIFSFNLNFFESLFKDSTDAIHELFEDDKPVYRFSQGQNSQLIDLFNQMYKASKINEPTANMLIVGLFAQLLSKLYSFRNSNQHFLDHINNSDKSSSVIENKIYEITSYIHQHYADNLTLEGIANHFYISPHYLSRQFKVITNFTLIQYIQETRIKRAQELLLDTNLKIIDIIGACGFGSVSQFNRVFSNLVGQSPTKYRKTNRL